MEEVQTNHNHVGDTDAASANDSNRIVSFIVGDEEGNENATNHNHMNGDALSHEDEKEKHDNFPGDEIKPSSGLDSKSSSYKDMFGLTERRKRLR